MNELIETADRRMFCVERKPYHRLLYRKTLVTSGTKKKGYTAATIFRYLVVIIVSIVGLRMCTVKRYF